MANVVGRAERGNGRTPTIPKLSSAELATVSGQHITELLDHERRTAAERTPTSAPRARRLGRALVLGWLSLVETFAAAWRWLRDPRRTPGRLMARPRLFAPTKTFGWWTLLLLAFAGVMGYLRFGPLEEKQVTFWVFTLSESHEPWKTITGTLAVGTLVALLALLWSDLFRLPFLAWRIRRRIIPRPERVLQANLLAKQGHRLVERLALDIVPREELYDDLLPGVLARDRKDVQILAGDAGAGKTTALLAIAQLLAQNGIVPVFVPLRSHVETVLIQPAEERFKKQVQGRVRSDAEADLLWRWLMLRRRVAILVDDIDQVGPDGERGLVLRKMLDEASESGLPVIVTSRSAGMPAGIAASAIDLGSLDERDAIDHVVKRAQDDPSSSCASRPSRRRIEEWVREGRLAEVPFYLELLAGLAAVGQCPRLAQASSTAGGNTDTGRVYRRPNGEWAWNPLWVRFHLLEHYYEQTILGRVRRSLGIEPRERASTMRALEDAALGMLVANSLAARMTLEPRAAGDSADRAPQPLRREIEEFINTDDRAGLRADDRTDGPDEEREAGGSERKTVSAHEVLDAGERLAILDLRGKDETTAFHHRIMQAYLAARCLVRREYRASETGRRPNPANRAPRTERDWIAALLDHRHPDRLTAHMTLTFAAMRAREIAEAPERLRGQGDWHKVGVRIVEQLIEGAEATRLGKPPDEEEQEQPCVTVTLLSENETETTQLTLALAPEDASDAGAKRNSEAEMLDPLYKPDFERRSDPDDALMKLVTAAEIVRAAPKATAAIERIRARRAQAADHDHELVNISNEMRLTPGATRWTKLRAIEAIAVPCDSNEEDVGEGKTLEALGGPARWERIWVFARDPDYDVKRAASKALEENAYEAFRALAPAIETLIERAAARSAYGHWLVRPEHSDGQPGHDALGVRALLALLTGASDGTHDVANWRRDEDIEALKALGSILPAIVSGFREDPSIDLETSWPAERGNHANGGASGTGASMRQDATDEEPENYITCHPPRIRQERLDYARWARRSLESLVALAFEGGHGDLESAVAQGFRSDALRHAQYPERNVTGPGWVTSNRQLVAGICLDHASFWYARIALYQALALYAIAGADAQETFDILARHMRRGGRDRHPFTQRAARLARAAVRRSELRSGRWLAYVWGDEGKDTGRRVAQLTTRAAQLLADVTVLLNLNQSSPEDRQDTFVQMQTLPYCLSGSRDRSEILGEGCPSKCGWGLCPYRQPPPDEPNGHRGVRRAFCRQQREISLRHKPPWQRGIHRKKLREFWREMEMRART
jgi:hypothetical protein